jgi:GGDEF domain-containing protein
MGDERRGRQSFVAMRPAQPVGLDPAALTAVHEATRALLIVASPRQAVDVVLDLVTALGGSVLPARVGAPDTLPLNLSFGVDEPMLAQADPASIARLHLELLLPAFLEDARQAVMALRDTADLRVDVMTDPLTGLLNRRSWDRQVHRLGRGDTVAMMWLDCSGELTKTAGLAAGQAVVATLGGLVRQFVGTDHLAARYGPHHLVMGITDTAPAALAIRLGQLERVWEAVRPHPVTVSTALAPVVAGAVHAVGEANEALSTAVSM